MHKILIYILFFCFSIESNGQSLTISDFTPGELKYPHNVYNADGNLIHQQRNLSFINRILQTDYSSYPASEILGHINGEYLQDYSGYEGCNNIICSGSCQHKGIDYAASTGTKLYSLISGKVIKSIDGVGKIAIYNSDANVTLYYLHCSSSVVAKDSYVTVGQLLGYSGSVGALGSHLHVELRKTENVSAACLQDDAGKSLTYDPRIIDDIFSPLVKPTYPKDIVTNLNPAAIILSWEPVYNADSYDVEIATARDFANGSIVIGQNMGSSLSETWKSAEFNTQYFWRVKTNKKLAFDDDDIVNEFRTRPNPPTILYPTKGQTDVSRCVTLEWKPTNLINNDVEYRVLISKKSEIWLVPDPSKNKSIVIFDSKYKGTIRDTKITIDNVLDKNTNYFWVLRIKNAKGISDWAKGSFKTGNGNCLTSNIVTMSYSVNAENFQTIVVNTSNNVNSNSSLNSVEQEVEIPLMNAKVGYNNVKLYFTDIKGNRSSIISKQILHLGTRSSEIEGRPLELEYWYDNDFAGRSALPLTENATDPDFNLNTDELDAGFHTLYYRTRAKGDLWSSILTHSFSKSTFSGGITQMEYWYNGQFDNRKLIQVNNLSEVDQSIPTDGLPVGDHLLSQRFQYAGGKWSGIMNSTFSKRSNNTVASGFKMQYWFDSAVGVPKSFAIQNPGNIDVPADASRLDTGWHVILARFQNNGGLWSCISSQTFYKSTESFGCNSIPFSDSEAVASSMLLCNMGILDNNNIGCFEFSHPFMKRKDLARLTYQALLGQGDPFTIANNLPSLFGDLQSPTTANSCYYNAAKLLSALDYGDGIAPFNPSRLNFFPNDSIVRGYALKVLMEAWDIKPDASLPNPYDDLVPGAEVNGYILKAASLGLIKRPDIHGPNFASFRPYRAINGEETLIMLYRILLTIGKPAVTAANLYLPFNRSNTAGNNPGIADGNFSSYAENPFIIKGVPSLNFSFNYNASLLELPDVVTKGNTWYGSKLYDQRPLGIGWTHSFNAYIVADIGTDDIAPEDDRYMIVWPGGNIQVYNPSQRKYLTAGVYDNLSYTATVGALPGTFTITTKSQIQYYFERLSGSSAANIYHLVSIKDRHNNAINLAYENGHSDTSIINVKRLKTVSDIHGRQFVFNYLPETNLIDSVTSNAGSIVRSVGFQYVANRLVKYTNPKGGNTIYNYGTTPGTEYLVHKIVLPRGNTISNTYSTNRKLTSSAFTNGPKTTIETKQQYSSSGAVTESKVNTIVDGKSFSSYTKSNSYGMPIVSEGPNSSDSIAYTDIANPLQPTYILNKKTGVEASISYDVKGNVLLVKRAAPGLGAISQSFIYNSKNDLTKSIDGKGNATQFIFNTSGQLTRVDAPIGATVITPNTNGTIQQMTNPSGIITSFGYDNFGNLETTNLPLGITTTQTNDAAGRITETKDPNNVGVRFVYDAHDNLVEETYDPVGLNYTTLYRFDDNNNLKEVENAKGNITSLGYNENDQMTQQQFGAFAKQFSYHGDGRMKSLTTPNKAVFNYKYNQLDQLVSDGYATYTYYEDGSLKTITRNGKTITYRYDAFKRVTQNAYDDFGSNTVGYTYDENNNITKLTYPGGFVVKYNYDANNRLVAVTDNAANAWATYSYLADGRLQTQTNRNGTIVKYRYDAAGRMDSLVTVKAAGDIIASYAFVLDKTGNHLSEKIQQPLMQMAPLSSKTDTFTYSITNRMLTRNDEQFAYDDNGNLITHKQNTSNENTLAYDTKDNLLRYQDGNGLITYDYDGLEQRRQRNETRFVLDNANNVLAETDLDGNPLYYYIHGLGLIGRVNAASAEPSYYHYDFRGSTVAITNSSQELTHQYSYDAFGVLQQAVEADFNAYRYVGKYGVAYEGKDLTFMRARYYQPSVGRFLGEDPVWGVNLYPYGAINPIKFIDPSGNVSVELNKRTGKLSLNLSLKEKWKLLMGTDVDFSTKIGDLKKDLKVLEDFKTLLDYDFKTREQRVEYLQKFLNTANEYTQGLVTPILDVLADNAIINGVKRAAIIVQATELGDATGDLETMFNYLNAQLSKISAPR